MIPEAAGRTLIDELLGHHVANQQRVLSTLDAGEQQQLNALLAKLLDGLADGVE